MLRSRLALTKKALIQIDQYLKCFTESPELISSINESIPICKCFSAKDRLQWEEEFDCIKKLKELILKDGMANLDELENIDKKARNSAKSAKNNAWKAFGESILEDQNDALRLINACIDEGDL